MKTLLILLTIAVGLLVSSPARAASISHTIVAQADSTAPVKPTVVKKQKPDTIAVLSLVLAAMSALNLGLLVILSPVAFVLGVIAIIRIGRSKGKRKGLGLAVVGTVLSGLWMALVVAFLTSYGRRG